MLMSILLSGELEVDGNLIVTGNITAGGVDTLDQVILIQQQQIANLLAIIAQLQAQIASLEAQMAFLGQDLNNADCNGVVGGDAVIDE